MTSMKYHKTGNYYFELKPRISISEKEFRGKIGDQTFFEITKEIFDRDKYKCKGCDVSFFLKEDAARKLQLHVAEINENEIRHSDFVSLCKICHLIQHFDILTKTGKIDCLANSTFSQAYLISLQRTNSLQSQINEDNFRKLKMTPEEYLKNLQEGALPKNSRIKIIMKDGYDFGI